MVHDHDSYTGAHMSPNLGGGALRNPTLQAVQLNRNPVGLDESTLLESEDVGKLTT